MDPINDLATPTMAEATLGASADFAIRHPDTMKRLAVYKLATAFMLHKYQTNVRFRQDHGSSNLRFVLESPVLVYFTQPIVSAYLPVTRADYVRIHPTRPVFRPYTNTWYSECSVSAALFDSCLPQEAYQSKMQIYAEAIMRPHLEHTPVSSRPLCLSMAVCAHPVFIERNSPFDILSSPNPSRESVADFVGTFGLNIDPRDGFVTIVLVTISQILRSHTQKQIDNKT